MKLKRFFALMLALALSLTMLQGVAFGANVGDEFRATTGKDANGQGVNIGAAMTFKVLNESGNTGTVQVGSSGVLVGNEDARAIAQNTSGPLTIPDKVTNNGITYTVTAIGEGAFSECLDLASVSIPDTVTTISQHAFYSCESLTSMALPAGLKTLGRSAFDFCKNLNSINLPTGLTEIETRTFANTALTSITIHEGVTSIGTNAFSGSQLTSIILPKGITQISSSAFDSCKHLTSIAIPAGVTAINGSVFYESAIKTITFEGSSIATLQQMSALGNFYAFDGVADLQTINLAGAFNQAMVDELAVALANSSDITLSNITINYNQSWTDEQVNKLIEEMAKITGRDGSTINTDNINPYNPNPAPTGGSTGTAGAGAWYIGTLNGADGQPTYTQIVDTPDTTAMLQAGSTITVTGQSPTGIIVKLDPTALAGKQSLSINSSIADMQLTAEQIASLIQQADGNTIHITIKGTATGSTISILAGGRTITL